MSISNRNRHTNLSISFPRNQDGLNENSTGRYYHLKEGPHALSTIITLSCVVIILIGCTLIGNTLVCLAVSIVRKLRKQSANYLLVSLAFADLCVGFMVMPLAFLYLVFGRWPFGRLLCDVWTTADVTLCTASILNLCMISVDRYLVIVQPLKYCPKRTSRLMVVYIVIVWISAFVVSLLPITFWHFGILTFWSPSPPETCQVSQNAAYQIYATMFAFYIPATIIMVVNYKIFKAARRLTLADRRASAYSCRATRTMIGAGVFVAATPVVTRHASEDGKSRRFSVRRILIWRNLITCSGRRKRSSAECCINRDGTAEERQPISDCADASANGAPIRRPIGLSGSWRNRFEPLRLSLSKQLTEALSIRRGRQRGSMSKGQWERFPMRGQQHSARIGDRTHRRHSEWPRGTPQAKARGDSGHWRRGSCRRHHASSSRETKAMKTLGLITGCFIACWLPFFIVALLKPLCPKHVCTIPGWFESLVLWLGYANSTLNPLLYAKYNKDFRIPFREILCCRLSTLKSVMRMEEYRDTFGSCRSSFAPATPTAPQIMNHCRVSSVPTPDAACSAPPTSRTVDECVTSRSLSSPAVLRQQHAQGLDTIV